ncbi:Uncharacterized protein Rs2_11747 [Raphanus sativus]|nr:Uncharacterized protein Rs2_11747 [Raphanus sativus]
MSSYSQSNLSLSLARTYELDERMQTEDLDAGLVGEKGNNQRVFKSKPMVTKDISTRYHRCGICGESGHNSRTCWKLVRVKPSEGGAEDGVGVGVGERAYACGYARKRDDIM